MNPLERLREIASAFGLSSAGGETSWFDASNPVCREAEKLLRAGRAAEAEEIFRKVLTEARYAALAKKQLPRILLALATAQIRQQKWDAADHSAARAWALLSELKYRTTPEYAECCRLRAEAAKGRGALDDALRLYLQGLGAVEAQKHPKPQEIVEWRIEISALLREMGRAQEAERMSAEAVRVAVENLEGSKENGDACLEWALSLAECQRHAEARQAGENAARIHRAACGDQSDELAMDFEKLGSICQKEGDFPGAVAYLEKALGIRERQVGGDSSELALLMVALADLYSLIGRLAPALELLQQAVGKLGPSKDGNLAGALEKLGSVYVRTGRYEDAAGCFQRAYDFWAASPEDHADRITANRQAYENLLPWLPEPAAPPEKQESPDTGISVLRQKSAGGHAGAGREAGGAGGLVCPQQAPVVWAAPLSPLPLAAAGGAAAIMGPAADARRADAAEPAPPPGLPVAAACPVPVPAASDARGGQTAAAAAASPPPAPAPPGLKELNDAMTERAAPHGFCGWEELEFERLTK